MGKSRGKTLVIMGMMGRSPFAGVAWQVLHYLEGFRRLGFDVYYVEDTGDWPYDVNKNSITDDVSYTVGHIRDVLKWFGFADRWAYRAASQGYQTFGLSESQVAELLMRTDILVNLTGATTLRTEHLRIPIRVYLETDPVLPQIEMATGKTSTTELLAAHTHHFTYGENIGRPDCPIPLCNFAYVPTRQPIILDWWSSQRVETQTKGSRCFTTIANWRQSGKDIEWKGEVYTWSKHIQFLKFIDLPQRVTVPIEMALAGSDDETINMLSSNGWRIVDAVSLSKDVFPYRDFIIASGGEFTVAKDQNIRLRSGWFSDRSACYLAAGKPVITQDTGFECTIPTGEGLFSFMTIEDILSAFDEVSANYAKHSKVARSIAEEYFKAEIVLSRLLNVVGI